MAHPSRRSRAASAERLARGATPAGPHPDLPTLPRWFEPVELAVYGLLLALVALVTWRGIDVEFALPKLLVFQTLMVPVAALWGARVWLGVWRPMPRPLASTVAALAVWFVVVTATSVDSVATLAGSHGRYNGLWTHLLLLALFGAAASSAWSPATVDRLLRWFAAVTVPVALVAIAQHLGLRQTIRPDRPPGTIGNPVILAAFLGVGVPILIYGFHRARVFAARAAWACGLALVLAAIAVTLSRGPWVGLAVALTVLCGGSWRVARVRARRLAAVLVVLAAIAGAMVAANRSLPGLLANRVRSFASPASDTAFRVRMVCYRAAAAMVEDHPLVGVGLEAFPLVLPEYMTATGGVLAQSLLPTMVHNVYLEKIVSGGVPLLMLHLVLVGLVLRHVHRVRIAAKDADGRLLALAVLAAAVGWLVQDLSGWLDIALSVPIWLLLGAGTALPTGQRLLPTPPTGGTRWLLLVLSAVVGVGAACLAFRSAADLRLEVSLEQCRWVDPDREGTRLEACAAAVGAAGSPYYSREAAILYLRRLERTPDPRVDGEAVRLLNEALRVRPRDRHTQVRRVETEAVAIRQGLRRSAPPEVEALIDRLRIEGAADPRVLETVARLRLAENRLAEARALIARSRTLVPREGRVWLLTGDIERAAGDLPAAIAAYRAALGLFPSGSREHLTVRLRLALNLLEAGDPRAGLAEAWAATVQAPADSMAFTLLGAAQARLDRPAEARTAFETALRLDPGNQAARRHLEALAVRRRP